MRDLTQTGIKRCSLRQRRRSVKPNAASSFTGLNLQLSAKPANHWTHGRIGPNRLGWRGRHAKCPPA
jgi:hypothetical protein